MSFTSAKIHLVQEKEAASCIPAMKRKWLESKSTAKAGVSGGRFVAHDTVGNPLEV